MIGDAELDTLSTDPEPLSTGHDQWGFEHVLLTPHVSGDTQKYWERRADVLVENVKHVADTGEYDDLLKRVARGTVGGD